MTKFIEFEHYLININKILCFQIFKKTDSEGYYIHAVSAHHNFVEEFCNKEECDKRWNELKKLLCGEK